MIETEILRRVKRALADIKAADKKAEQASMAAFEVFRILKFGNRQLTPAAQQLLERADKAHSQLGDARGSLGDAHYQLEQGTKRVGRDPKRRK